MRICILLLSALITTVLASDALACSDSLYRVGKIVAYRSYFAPLPGNVLIYGRSDSGKDLADGLARSGHSVRFVDNADELRSEIQTGAYDVVIADYRERATIESSREAAAQAGATFLPVVQSKDEASQAEREYDSVILPRADDIRPYLKAIHSALKRSLH
ncbi:MAG TPA: hypothetical protein VE175_15580 [Woeseiaceae bacterium]|nr:hypothetical protein [Woeseiaceae bacterium]